MYIYTYRYMYMYIPVLSSSSLVNQAQHCLYNTWPDLLSCLGGLVGYSDGHENQRPWVQVLLRSVQLFFFEISCLP